MRGVPVRPSIDAIPCAPSEALSALTAAGGLASSWSLFSLTAGPERASRLGRPCLLSRVGGAAPGEAAVSRSTPTVPKRASALGFARNLSCPPGGGEGMTYTP